MKRLVLPSLAAMLSPSLLVLAACGQSEAPPPPPLPDRALQAVSADPGVPRERLARAVDQLFTRPGIGETRAVVVMHEGKVVAERYADGYGADTRFTGWSMSKTVTGVLVGMLVADGKLRLDDPAPIRRWRRAGDPRGEITLRHLLQMRSGLRHQEQAEPVYQSGEVRMMYLDGRDDMAGWAEAQPLDHEPGTHFEYSTPTAVILADIIARTLAPEGTPTQRQQAVAEFLDSRLAKLGQMESMVAEYDAAGTMVGGSSVWADARDWARFGEMLRNGGSVRGVQVVPRGWIAFMEAEDPQAPDYGAQLWRNRDSCTERDMLFAEHGPDDLVAAIGHLGQYVLVSPSRKLTVVRLGKTDQDARPALVAALGELVALYPDR